MAAPTAKRPTGSMGRRSATVTYKDGRTETYPIDSPFAVMKLNRVGIKDDIDQAFFLMWFGAGHPGVDEADLATLTQDSAIRAIETWIQTTAVIDSDEGSRPPTSQEMPPE